MHTQTPEWKAATHAKDMELGRNPHQGVVKEARVAAAKEAAKNQ
jgi:hypothetical protein